jgi:HAMP domain-containing protein
VLGKHWTVIGFSRTAAATAGMQTVTGLLPVLLLVAAVLVAACVFYLSSRWQPALRALRGGLDESQRGRYQRIVLGNASDTPREVGAEFNRAIVAIQNRMQALASLNEIDRLLLESADLGNRSTACWHGFARSPAATAPRWRCSIRMHRAMHAPTLLPRPMSKCRSTALSSMKSWSRTCTSSGTA